MATEVRWFFSESGEVRGPYLESDLIRLARTGRISESEYILREGYQEWLSAGPLVQNANALPIDGEARVPFVAVPKAPAVEQDADGGGGPRTALWIVGVLILLGLSGFAFYMLGPWSPILHQPTEVTTIPDSNAPAPEDAGASASTPAPSAQPPAPADPADVVPPPTQPDAADPAAVPESPSDPGVETGMP